MKKDLFLITNSYPYGTGEEFIQNEVEYLSKEFNKVFILTMNQNDKKTKDIPNNFVVYRLKKSKLNLLRLLKPEYLSDFFSEKVNLKKIKNRINFMYTGDAIKNNILEIVKKEKLSLDETVLYSYWFYSGAYGISKIKSDKTIKISRAHGYDLYAERGPQPLKNNIFSKIDWLLPCSLQGAEYLKNKYPKYKNKIEKSYLGTENTENQILKKDNYNLVSCSYIRPVKRIHLIVEALEKLNLNTEKIKWTHIGDGDGLEELKMLAKEKLKNIEFEFLGHLKNDEILNYYKENDIKCFINLSSSEGLPVSMMEVQSFGIPIVATDVGGVKEIVNEKTGILLSENPTPEEVADGIKKILLLSKEEYSKIQKSCYKFWSKNFNAKINYNKFIQKYLKGKV
ncbi:MAG: glycosyltransferase [Fusobacteriaceae bacterium]